MSLRVSLGKSRSSGHHLFIPSLQVTEVLGRPAARSCRRLCSRGGFALVSGASGSTRDVGKVGSPRRSCRCFVDAKKTSVRCSVRAVRNASFRCLLLLSFSSPSSL